MVWWVDRRETDYEDCKVYDRYDIDEDRIFQTVNIMFNFAEAVDDPYGIRALLTTGVNIFNFDRTLIDDKSFKVIKKAIVDCFNLNEMHPEPFPNPVSLALTMSVTKPVKIEKEINVVILKNVSNEEEVTDFKALNTNSNLPIILWITKSYNEHSVIDLINVSDGIIIDHSVVNDPYCYDVIELCKKNKKPIFSLKPELWEDNTDYKGSKRKLFAVASEVIKSGVDGIVVNDCKNTIIDSQTKVIRKIVEAMHVAEGTINPEKQFAVLRKQIQPPQLVSVTVAISASLAALQSGSAAILVLTSTGRSAHLVSCAAAPCPILGLSIKESVVKEMNLYRKVMPLHYQGARVSNWRAELRNRVLFGIDFGTRTGLFGDEAKLVVLAPSTDDVGYCDNFQIITLPYTC